MSFQHSHARSDDFQIIPVRKRREFHRGQGLIPVGHGGDIEAVSGKVLADAIVTDETLAVSREWNVNGEKVTIGVEKTEK